jgi:glycerophosphoryl diester phosphodiesterase
MRSSRSKPDPLDPGPIGFAHRGLHGPGVPENSLRAFRAAVAAGAGIECDVRLAADVVPIIFHDRDALRLCGSSSIISETGSARLSALRLLDSAEGIPTLADLLALVSGRVPLLLELKDDGNVQRLCAAVVDLLDKYEGPAGVMSFSADAAHWLRLHAPMVRRGLVMSGRDSRFRRWLNFRSADPQFLAVKSTELGKRWTRAARSRMPLYSWTITSPVQLKTAEIHADAPIWEGDGRPRS